MQYKHNSSDSFTRCSFCGREIARDKMILLDEQDQKTVLHMTCKQCNTATLVFIYNNNAGGSMGMGIATDMDHLEVVSKLGESPVSTDEVISVHKLLSNYKGNSVDFIKKV